jgi:Asp-tRNA(Asn)/Glu-tRNA(Gln) amidotransferase A subunit family amidase
MPAAPRISGRALRSLARFARTRVGAAALSRVMRGELRLRELEALPDDARGPMPVDTRPLQGRPPRRAEDLGLPPPADKAWSGTSAAYARAYREGTTTPRAVAERALSLARDLAARSCGPLCDAAGPELLREADEATARYRAGRPHGPLDGVPYVVKEMTQVRGLPCRAGSDLETAAPAAEDATVVARLRAAGALALGTTPMTEYGMTPLGFNPKRRMPKNPHASDRVAGGSSTGSGVAVATGLAPFAIGADGGGSIRIPSAVCGVFGIKPTWGRVSRAGNVTGGTVAHVGPLASSVLDLARFLEVTAAPDPADPQTDLAPPLPAGSLVKALGRGVRGLRIAFDEREWAGADGVITKAGQEALRALEKEGAELVKVELTVARYAAAIGYMTIGIEDRAEKRAAWRDRPQAFTPDLQITYAVLDTFQVKDYWDGLRLRSGVRAEMQRLFGRVDLYALPTTATPAVRATDAEMESGFLDARALDALCHFNFLGNLTGLPALSAPVGLDADGLPIGLQLVGDAWDEATVLAAAAHLERLGVARVERPNVHVDVLGG